MPSIRITNITPKVQEDKFLFFSFALRLNEPFAFSSIIFGNRVKTATAERVTTHQPAPSHQYAFDCPVFFDCVIHIHRTSRRIYALISRNGRNQQLIKFQQEKTDIFHLSTISPALSRTEISSSPISEHFIVAILSLGMITYVYPWFIMPRLRRKFSLKYLLILFRVTLLPTCLLTDSPTFKPLVDLTYLMIRFLPLAKEPFL